MIQSKTVEANFDGLVGPTHHYAGHSFGNVASTSHARQISNPKKAALQGLKKAAALRDLGVLQGILPPLRRPKLSVLKSLGFAGSDAQVIERSFKSVPKLLSAAYSASSMWVANAATVSPSADTLDHKVHFTVANLSSKFHRSIEWPSTKSHLQKIFNGDLFVHHDSVPPQFGDEGAANHNRLCDEAGSAGIEIFVFGGCVLQPDNFIKPQKFPARQSIEASHAIATLHQLDMGSVAIVQQNPMAIDAGVFHNDVISVAHENVFLFHEKAFAEQQRSLDHIKKMWKGKRQLEFIEVKENHLSLDAIVKSYLFNSQLITLTNDKMALICPEECRESPDVWAEIQKIISKSKWIKEVHTFDLRESMKNGGGPACLRLRVVLTPEEQKQVHPNVWLTPDLESKLTAWIQKHYRDKLEFDDLSDPQFLIEVNKAYDALEQILGFSIE